MDDGALETIAENGTASFPEDASTLFVKALDCPDSNHFEWSRVDASKRSASQTLSLTSNL